MGLYKNYLNDKSYEHKSNVMKMEKKTLEYELRRYEGEGMGKI